MCEYNEYSNESINSTQLYFGFCGTFIKKKLITFLLRKQRSLLYIYIKTRAFISYNIIHLLQ